MAANNNAGRSVDHAAPLMRHLSNYAQEIINVMVYLDVVEAKRIMRAEMERVIFKSSREELESAK